MSAAREAVIVGVAESDLGVTCVASPIYRFGEQVVAAISVTGPVTRLDPERYAPTVRLAALAELALRYLAGDRGRPW